MKDHYWRSISGSQYPAIRRWLNRAEAESKEKHGVWDPMPELTMYPHLMSTLESTPTHLPLATLYQSVDLNSMPESTLFSSQVLLFGFWRKLSSRICNPEAVFPTIDSNPVRFDLYLFLSLFLS